MSQHKGIFEVDITALDLPGIQLDKLETKINAVVADAIASAGLKNPVERILHGPGTRGIRYRLSSTGLGAVPIKPYGVAIQEAVKSGDLERMKSVLADSEAYIETAQNIEAAVSELKSIIKDRS